MICLASLEMDDKPSKDPNSAPLYVLTLRWQTEKGIDKRRIGFSTEVERLEWQSILDRLKGFFFFTTFFLKKKKISF